MQPPPPTEASDIGAAVSEGYSWVGAGCSVDSWRLVAKRGAPTLSDVIQRRMLHGIAIALLVVIAYALLANTVALMRGGLGV
jgi:hypothetical protein